MLGLLLSENVSEPFDDSDVLLSVSAAEKRNDGGRKLSDLAPGYVADRIPIG